MPYRVVSVDLLFLANLLADLVLLLAAGAWAGQRAPCRRLLGAAAIGAALGVAAVFPGGRWLAMPPALVAVPLLMAAVAFRPASLLQAIKLTGCLFAVAFMMGGGALAATLASGAPGTAGASAAGAALAAVGIGLSLAAGRLMWGQYVARARIGPMIKEVTVVLGPARMRLHALVDTGHQLTDPLTGRAVLVAAYSSCRPALPPPVAACLDRVLAEQGRLCPVALAELPLPWRQRFRVVPYASLGRPDGLMLVCRADAVWCGPAAAGPGAGAAATNLVGLMAGPVHPAGLCTALIPPAALPEWRETPVGGRAVAEKPVAP